MELFFQYIQKPVCQALLFIGLSFLYYIILSPKNVDSLWSISAVFYVGFIFFNAIGLFFAPSLWGYFFISIGFSVAYVIGLGLLIPILIKMFDLKGSGESAMAFLFIIYHPFILLAALLVKWVYGKVM